MNLCELFLAAGKISGASVNDNANDISQGNLAQALNENDDTASNTQPESGSAMQKPRGYNKRRFSNSERFTRSMAGALDRRDNSGIGQFYKIISLYTYSFCFVLFCFTIEREFTNGWI